MLLPITLTFAAALTLLNLWLSIRVGQARMRGKVIMGDGGDPLVIARMRAHANFNEYTPLVVILMGLVELARGPHTWLWIVAIVYVIARVSHPFGMERKAPNPLRAGGIMITYLVMLVLAVYALMIGYSVSLPHVSV
jgi:uncharacterized membrane protein YecN with MAPEG domain